MPRLGTLALGSCLLLAACGGPEVQFNRLLPEIAVFPEAVDFGEVVVLRPEVQQLAIQNAGRGTLNIQGITLEDPEGVFTLLNEPAEIEPDSTFTMGIEFAPVTFLRYEASLTIHSNDEHTPEVVIPILGEGVDAPMPDIHVDPLSLDFGEVGPGGVSTKVVNILNRGNAVLQMGMVDQSGSGAFQLLSDPSNAIVGPGSTLPVVINYIPTSDQGDNGELKLFSDDPDEPEVKVLLLGNGGGDFEYPEAVIDCPGRSAPPQWVFLDGSGSTDPLGGALSYMWSLPTRPLGSAGTLSQTVLDNTELYTDISGDYIVQLVVANEQGTVSAPARCLVEAIPEDDLHVELTWDTTNTDVDLHLLQDGFTMFDKNGDCHWCNKNPKWGAAGPDDDPRLDLDDTFDGPENINILHPADGTYHIKVHYYGGTAGAVTATVKVYAYGTEVFTGSKVMRWDEVWDVGQVNWPDGTVGVANKPLYKAPRRSCL